MAFIAEDRVRDVSTSTTSPFSVSGTAPNKYKTFDDVMAVSDTCCLLIIHQTANEWEVGIYTKTAADQLTRTTVLNSSLGDAAVTFSAGTKDVIMVYPPVGTTAEYLANTVGRILSTDQVNASGAFQGLTVGGSTIPWNMATQGWNVSFTLSATPRTLENPTNPIVGRTGMIVVTQDATGSRVLNYGTQWDAAGGTLPVLSTAANAVDVIFYIVRTTTSFLITGILKAIS